MACGGSARGLSPGSTQPTRSSFDRCDKELHRGQLEHTLVLMLDRPGHQDAIVGTPLDLEWAARQSHPELALGQLLARSANGSSARRAAAGAGEARAALPNAQLHAVGRDHLGERDVDALGE